MNRHLLALAVVALIPSSSALAGSSKAWNAAKGVHQDAPIIAGIDVASAKSSETFKKFYPVLLEKKKDVGEVLEKLKTACKFDPFVAVNSAVAVVDDQNEKKGAFYIALNGWDAKKLGACAQKVAKGEKKDLIVGKVDKGIQELSMKGETDKIYLGWIGSNVLVVSTDPTNRDLLQSVMTGKGEGTAHAMAAKVDTSATLWMAVVKENQVQPGITMKGIYGTVKLAKGNMAGDLHVVTADAKQATSLVDQFNKQIPAIQGNLPPAMQTLIKSMKMNAQGAEVQTTAAAPEKDILDLVGMVLGNM